MVKRQRDETAAAPYVSSTQTSCLRRQTEHPLLTASTAAAAAAITAQSNLRRFSFFFSDCGIRGQQPHQKSRDAEGAAHTRNHLQVSKKWELCEMYCLSMLHVPNLNIRMHYKVFHIIFVTGLGRPRI
jgi:hypothetical protein